MGSEEEGREEGGRREDEEGSIGSLKKDELRRWGEERVEEEREGNDEEYVYEERDEMGGWVTEEGYSSIHVVVVTIGEGEIEEGVEETISFEGNRNKERDTEDERDE